MLLFILLMCTLFCSLGLATGVLIAGKNAYDVGYRDAMREQHREDLGRRHCGLKVLQ